MNIEYTPPSPASGPAKSSFANGTRLLVAAIALSYLAAFLSFWLQSAGLIGPSGILPAGDFLTIVHSQLGPSGWFEVPTLCWLFGTGAAIAVLCAVGMAAALCLLCGFAPALCLLAMWACYLSLVSVGQIFFDFQWDGLLLEATLIAVFLVPWRLSRTGTAYDPPKLARCLTWWLLFRLMFMSGLVKLTSGDPTWRSLTALSFHFETQPLPTVLGWFAAHLPRWIQVLACLLMFVIELAAPLCLIAPRRLRHAAALSLVLLQVAIAATGNFAFFNLLAIGLCLSCLDDEWWRSVHWGVEAPVGPTQGRIPRWVSSGALRWFAALSVGVTFFESVAEAYPGAARSPLVRFVAETVGPLRSFNDYGLFAVMTVERPELVFEGSNDGRSWKEYTLPYQPGALDARPKWIAPLQPRLDWQLWFAALGPPDNNPWVETVCERLLRGERAVTELFAGNPFPEVPPKYMRVVRYRYECTSTRERSLSGKWWRRTPLDFYVRPVELPKP